MLPAMPMTMSTLQPLKIPCFFRTTATARANMLRSWTPHHTGSIAKSSHTIAVDPRIIPYEQGYDSESSTPQRTASVSKKPLDIFFDTHAQTPSTKATQKCSWSR